MRFATSNALNRIWFETKMIGNSARF